MTALAPTTTLRRAGQYPALVLNADFSPLSRYPLSVWPWEEAVHASLSGRVIVLAEHERLIRSPSVSLKAPSVVALKDYVKVKRTPAFTRQNVFLRDKFSCAYCGQKHNACDLTFDHVIPRSRGGHTRWQNIVTACGGCNVKKGNRTPEEAHMVLQWRPWSPSADDLARGLGRLPTDQLHVGWGDYLFWDSAPE